MINSIAAEDLLEKIQNKEKFQLIDVLLPLSYNKWHIPGAINISINEFEFSALKILDKNEIIILYCSSRECKTSYRAAKILAVAGFTSIFVYSGGKKEWIEKNYPVEKG